tara:strand:+ start:31 stop:633 length:603 start_codon:yes stop_codon:yes gene_type:complete
MGILTAFILVFLAFTDLEARPISYPGGSTIMAFSNDMKNSVYYHYSPSYKYSVGMEIGDDRFFREEYSYLRFTYLANRKNTPHSQRNLYFQSGISSDGLDNYFFGAHGDWETRRWFVGFEVKGVEHTSSDYHEQIYQIGVAPYLGAYGDLHSWLMLKTKRNSLKNNWSALPVLKLFKGNFLMEFGYNTKTDWDAHLMYRF